MVVVQKSEVANLLSKQSQQTSSTAKAEKDISLKTIKHLRYFQGKFPLPESFFNHMEAFALRNAHSINNSNLDIDKVVCAPCLKAHIIFIAKRSEFDQKTVRE